MTQAATITDVEPAVTLQEAREIEQFLYLEARLADESRYSEWEALVEDDMVYWIPIDDGNSDPRKHVSITYDNRSRLANRIKQLNTGRRMSQRPPSPMRRMIANVESVRSGADEYEVGCNFILYELPMQAAQILRTWPGRTTYRLRRRAGGGLGIFYKKVVLVTAGIPVNTIPFIL